MDERSFSWRDIVCVFWLLVGKILHKNTGNFRRKHPTAGVSPIWPSENPFRSAGLPGGEWLWPLPLAGSGPRGEANRRSRTDRSRPSDRSRRSVGDRWVTGPRNGGPLLWTLERWTLITDIKSMTVLQCCISGDSWQLLQCWTRRTAVSEEDLQNIGLWWVLRTAQDRNLLVSILLLKQLGTRAEESSGNQSLGVLVLNCWISFEYHLADIRLGLVFWESWDGICLSTGMSRNVLVVFCVVWSVLKAHPSTVYSTSYLAQIGFESLWPIALLTGHLGSPFTTKSHLFWVRSHLGRSSPSSRQINDQITRNFRFMVTLDPSQAEDYGNIFEFFWQKLFGGESLKRDKPTRYTWKGHLLSLEAWLANLLMQILRRFPRSSCRFPMTTIWRVANSDLAKSATDPK